MASAISLRGSTVPSLLAMYGRASCHQTVSRLQSSTERACHLVVYCASIPLAPSHSFQRNALGSIDAATSSGRAALQSICRRRGRANVTACGAERRTGDADTTMWAGDAVVLLLTQLSSTRLPLENSSIVSLLLLATWSAVALAKRDYDVGSADYDAWSVEGPVSTAVQSAAFTWVIFAPLTAAVYSSLVAQHLLPGSSDHHGLAGFGSGLLWLATPDASVSAAAPEIEVLVATLFCITAWRGLYAAYRTWSNFN